MYMYSLTLYSCLREPQWPKLVSPTRHAQYVGQVKEQAQYARVQETDEVLPNVSVR